MESCFGTIKTELEMTEYENDRVAQEVIADYLDYYLTERKHSALGYLTPQQFEEFESRGPMAKRASRDSPQRG